MPPESTLPFEDEPRNVLTVIHEGDSDCVRFWTESHSDVWLQSVRFVPPELQRSRRNQVETRRDKRFEKEKAAARRSKITRVVCPTPSDRCTALQHRSNFCGEKKKNEVCQELSLQARDLRFQHSTSLTTRNNCIIIRMESLKAIVTPQSLLLLDFRGLGLERWLVMELAPQLASQTHSLPFEFRALEAILQHTVNTLQGRLNEVEPAILDTLEYLLDPKILSADRSKLHILLQNSKSLSELETDVRVFKESLLKILDEDEIIEELCLTKWTDPRVFEESSLGIDHAEEMELLLENYYMQAEELGNKARELKGLIDDSESVIFINLDSHRNVMMRLNLQLTMGTFSLSLFGLIGVAFGMNLESSFEEDPRVFWLVTGFMFLGSGLIWRRLLSFLGRNLEPSFPLQIPPVWKRNLKASDIKPGIRC
ncbi:magnesium transporter MRS2 homolog, mitochondrial isoform X2 [Synchiropus splendidus]|uniref:magnesium transporter MRS2 homolog, mitochondrial isoform X2 n=1 Tax=Synchiropus splendidus TaxID=270530 RepID=UPI00237EDA43|nr:magnesium transporter MRS2 homolog, mitochondrial isoform X2 [Synchiropus splendidus]